MSNAQLSILIVDDAKFSSAMIGRSLSQAGYRDLRFASSAAEALQQLQERPANVLLADWLMPEVDGLQLTGHIRQLDELNGHYTYIILLTGKEGENVLHEAFERGVDDFISKAEMSEQLLPRIHAAERLCRTLFRLLQGNQQLQQHLAAAERHSLVDAVTGLGNQRLIEQRLKDCLRQIESRGGVLCYLLIDLSPSTSTRQPGSPLWQELQVEVARRLQHLIRPLDVLACLDEQRFALAMLVDDDPGCSGASFKRLHEALNLKAFKTSEGFIQLKADIVMLSLDKQALPIDTAQLQEQAAALLPQARSSGRVLSLRLPGKA